MSDKGMKEWLEDYPLGSRHKWTPPVSNEEDLWVEVEVANLRPGFGRVDIQVRPVCGGGTAWTRHTNLSPLDPESRSEG